jgi:hypothetical protein
MDFPLFHMDWVGNRWLVGITAILHVLINHSLAVGFIPLMVWLEKRSLKTKAPGAWLDESWDQLIYRMMFVAFVITTSVGAMTGVGIWFSAALVSPASIGSLIRVFYWAWFTEWLVFVTEVCLILWYFLTWKKANHSLEAKKKHISTGFKLAVFSWITMAIIVAILGFMMDPGNWLQNKSFISGVLNPLYLPQLAFRTPVAMLMGGAVAMVLVFIFARGADKVELKAEAVKKVSAWNLFWAPLTLAGGIWYYYEIPDGLRAHLSTAVGTMEFEKYYKVLWFVLTYGIALSLVISLIGYLMPRLMRWWMTAIVFMLAMTFLGTFERVREFIRKPYIIANYMYSNQLRVEDYPLYQRDGLLVHSPYSRVPMATDSNLLYAGREMYMIACSRCHTTHGNTSVVRMFERMYGPGEALKVSAMTAYMPGMHKARSYMPPFPGNKMEAKALATYIQYLQATGTGVEGVQSTGLAVNPLHSAEYQLQKKK